MHLPCRDWAGVGDRDIMLKGRLWGRIRVRGHRFDLLCRDRLFCTGFRAWEWGYEWTDEPGVCTGKTYGGVGGNGSTLELFSCLLCLRIGDSFWILDIYDVDDYHYARPGAVGLCFDTNTVCTCMRMGISNRVFWNMSCAMWRWVFFEVILGTARRLCVFSW